MALAQNSVSFIKNVFSNTQLILSFGIIALYGFTYFAIFDDLQKNNQQNLMINSLSERTRELISQNDKTVFMMSLNHEAPFSQWKTPFEEVQNTFRSQVHNLREIMSETDWNQLPKRILENHQKLVDLVRANPNNLMAIDDTKTKLNNLLAELKFLIENKKTENENTFSSQLTFKKFLLLFNLLTLIIFAVHYVRNINSTLKSLYQYKNEKDEAQEHMTLMGELTSGVNHEIKNIICVAGLHSTQLSNQLKKQKPLTSEQILNSVQKIENSVNRAEKIIRSVNRLSFDSKNQDKVYAPLHDVVHETQEFASFFTNKHEVQLRIGDVDPKLSFYGHPIQISQVLVNLIKNATEAIEHNEEKWIELKILFQSEKKQIEIRIVDSGLGIPESVREKLFQKQFTTKAIGKGTGLGLTISAKIIAEHNGKLYVDDKAKNTTFVILLPGYMKAEENTNIGSVA